jgi:hypothetical protein
MRGRVVESELRAETGIIKLGRCSSEEENRPWAAPPGLQAQFLSITQTFRSGLTHTAPTAVDSAVTLEWFQRFESTEPGMMGFSNLPQILDHFANLN